MTCPETMCAVCYMLGGSGCAPLCFRDMALRPRCAMPRHHWRCNAHLLHAHLLTHCAVALCAASAIPPQAKLDEEEESEDINDKSGMSKSQKKRWVGWAYRGPKGGCCGWRPFCRRLMLERGWVEATGGISSGWGGGGGFAAGLQGVLVGCEECELSAGGHGVACAHQWRAMQTVMASVRRRCEILIVLTPHNGGHLN